MSFPPLPPLHLNMNTRSGDISGRTAFGASNMDGSGWTVNMRTRGSASGAVQQRPSIAQALGASVGSDSPQPPWLLIIGAIVAIKLLKH